MGACLSCCGESSDKQLYETATRDRPSEPRRKATVDTEADRAARASAADAALARHQKFEESAGGRAAMKAVREVRQERQQAANRAGEKDTAADWLT